MKIVVLDGHTLNPGDNPWNDLAALGDLVVYDRSPPEEVVLRALDADVVLTNKTILDAAVVAALPRLQCICVLATGFNVVDATAARSRGIPVCNVPEYGTDSVAQHVFALLLELCQHVGTLDAEVRAGEWTRARDFSFWHDSPVELAGLTLGIIGYGRIGQRVGEIGKAFGMQIVASQSPISHQGDHSIPRFPMEELATKADVISLHCPLTGRNERFVNAEFLARMKPSAFLINTARGGLIDEAALAAALRSGSIGGAALDVVSSEPMRADNPLLDAPRCVITPHMAWASLAARRRLMKMTVANVRAFSDGKPQNVVNG